MTDIVTHKPKTTSDFLNNEQFKKSLKMALPTHMSPDRMVRIALTELRRTPKLNECSPMSYIGAIVQCSQLGLEPGNNLGHAYLIPFENYRTKTTECQLIMGYRGMIELARRSGQVITLQSHCVYENDTFEYEYGLQPKLRHIPARKQRGNIIYVYACAALKEGGHQFEVMSKEDIEAIMSQSKSSKSGPWQTHFEEMARKTVIRRLFKYLPVSIELTKAVAIDEAADYGGQDNSSFIDYDLETGEFESTPVPSVQNKTNALVEKLNKKEEMFNAQSGDVIQKQ